MKKIGILGSTGSIGSQCLEIIKEHPQQFNLSLGDEATLLTTSADGATVVSNFTVVGTLSFGIQANRRIIN